MRVKWRCSGCGADNVSDNQNPITCFKCGKERSSEGILTVPKDTPLTLPRKSIIPSSKRRHTPAREKNEPVPKEKAPHGSFLEKIKLLFSSLSAKLGALKEKAALRREKHREHAEAERRSRLETHWVAEISENESSEAFIRFKPDDR